MRLNFSLLEGAFLSALVVSVGLNGFLLAQTQPAFAVRTPSPVNDVHVGEEVPPLRLENHRGESVTVGYAGDSRPTVLYVFADECGWCEENERNIQHLYGAVGDRFRFVALTPGDDVPRAEPAQTEWRLPTYFRPSPATREAFGFEVVPQTIVISPDGRVMRNWPGVYVGPVKTEVESFFGVRLPGLLSERPPSRLAAGNGSLCHDESGAAYSPGAVAILDGQMMECDDEGRWVAAR